MSKFFEVTNQHGVVVSINAADVSRFYAIPNGTGTRIHFRHPDTDSLTVKDEYKTVRDRVY